MRRLTQEIRVAAWQSTFALLDRMRPQPEAETRHLYTGQLGEEAAFFYLRGAGFTVIAQGWQSGKAPGDLDLVAWEGDTLCFVEVKTRASRAIASAESSVDRGKRRSLRRLAGHYMRQLPPETPVRFDVLSIYLRPGKSARHAEFELFRNCFGWKDGERLPF